MGIAAAGIGSGHCRFAEVCGDAGDIAVDAGVTGQQPCNMNPGIAPQLQQRSVERAETPGLDTGAISGREQISRR